MRTLKGWTLWYFASVGLVLHLALAAVWFLRPELVWKVEERATTWLFERFPSLAWGDAARKQFTDEQIFDLIPAWQPLPLGTDAPPAGQARVAGRVFGSLQEAAKALTSGDHLDIGPGTYNAPFTVRASDVSIIGHGHVVFEKGVTQGKGSMVIASDNVLVRNIECRQIAVRHRNGACIRLEGKDLIVDHVWFHDSQQGILTGSNPGLVEIRRSRFERLGYGGKAHGIYVNGGKLRISDSLFLAAKGQGHEIKSRAAETTILRSVIASLNGVDSRLIDIPNGGTLTIVDSVLLEGPNTANWDVIGFALETGVGHHPTDQVVLRNNLILIDRDRSSDFLHLADGRVRTDIIGNVIVSVTKTPYDESNVVFRSRKEAGLPDYPALPLDALRLGN